MPVIYYTHYLFHERSVRENMKQEHILGRQLLAAGLKELHRISYSSELLEKAISVTKTGKPYLADHPQIHFNISHCKGLVLCAFDRVPIGADAECPGPFVDSLIRKALSETEKELLREKGQTESLREEWFFRLWTLKEAYIKWSGQGLSTDLSAISFYPEIESEPSVFRCSDPAVSCWQTTLASGHIISICGTEIKKTVELRNLRPE